MLRSTYSFVTDFLIIETNPLICNANQWTGFFMIGTSVMKDSKVQRNLS